MQTNPELVTVGLECVLEDHHDIELQCSAAKGTCACPCHFNPVHDGGVWKGIETTEWVRRIMKGAGLLPPDDARYEVK